MAPTPVNTYYRLPVVKQIRLFYFLLILPMKVQKLDLYRTRMPVIPSQKFLILPQEIFKNGWASLLEKKERLKQVFTVCHQAFMAAGWFQICDGLGRTITQKTITNGLSNFDTHTWPAGIYSVRILGTAKTHSNTIQVIRQKF